MAKRQKANKGKDNSFTIDEMEKDLWPEDKTECNHNWHLAKSIENFMTGILYCTFVCSVCGKTKKIEGRE